MVGINIKKRRKELKLTQGELSKKINVSPQVISNWERGYTTPSSDDLSRLAPALDCSPNFLLGIEENNTDEKEFQGFINDPELQVWYKELPKNDEEELRRLKEVWEIIKRERK